MNSIERMDAQIAKLEKEIEELELEIAELDKILGIKPKKNRQPAQTKP